MLSSFYPVVAGRISDASARYRSLYQVQVGKIGLQQLEQQLSTGQRFQLPSDDPTAAIRVMGLQRELENREQTVKNLTSAQSYLNSTEATLGTIQDTMIEMRGLGVEASTNVTGATDREGWINQINASIDRLVGATNSRYLDRFLLSGGKVGTETVANTTQSVRFKGNDLSLLSIADTGDYFAHNVTGQKALGLLSENVVGRRDLNPTITPNTRIADLNNGQGVAPGAIRLSDGSAQVTIDFAGTETVDDLLKRFNGNVTLAGRGVSLSIANGGLSIDYNDGNGGTLRVEEVGSGRTATDLGIRSTTPNPALPIQGNNLDPILRATTRISTLQGGVGIDLSGGIRIVQGGKNFDVALTGVETVEDLNNAINRSGAAVIADIDPEGRAIRVRSVESGTDFSITELNGNVAETLGLRTFHAQTALSELDYGRGVVLGTGNDIVLTRNDGTEFGIDLDGAVTIQDVLDRINSHPDNLNSDTRITASLRSDGNGIRLSSDVYVPPVGVTAPNAGPIKIKNAGSSQAAYALGLLPAGQLQATANTGPGGYDLLGKDSNPKEVKGIFNSLQRLRDAIQQGNTTEIARSVELIDNDLSRLSLSRGSLGVEQQRIENLIQLQEENKIELKADESRNFDADIVSVISEMNARQVAYEASLKLLGSANQTSLFNYI